MPLIVSWDVSLPAATRISMSGKDKAHGNAQFSATCRTLLETVEEAKRELGSSHARMEARLDVAEEQVEKVVAGLRQDIDALRENLREKKDDERSIRQSSSSSSSSYRG